MPSAPFITGTTAAGLPGAVASKLHGVCTIEDSIVRGMLESFGEVTPEAEESPPAGRVGRVEGAQPLGTVIAVGSSLTSLPNPQAPHKLVGYVRVASVRVETEDVAQLASPVVN